jgi:hypothetical protein
MSTIELIRKFVDGTIDAYEFEDRYFLEYRHERDNGILIGFNENHSLLITSVFCNIDITCFDETPLEYEIDVHTLKKRVRFLLNSYDNGVNMNQATTNVIGIF